MKTILPMTGAILLGLAALAMLLVACTHAADEDKAANPMPPKAGDPAPDFALPDQDGMVHALRDLRGQWVVLYFYPKDDTPGCTRQACTMRDRLADFTARRVRVFGINPDSVASHRAFASKHNLTFPLLADGDRTVVRAYGVWGRLGGLVPLTARTTFLITPEGTVAKVYPQASPTDNADEILADLATLGVPAPE